jgi:hypothetical protein
MDWITASHASASIPPGSQPDSRSHETPASASAAGPALAQHRPALLGRDRLEGGRRGQGRQHRRVGDGVVVVAAVQEVAEQRRLAPVRGGRVGELDDVGHADLAGQAVITEGSPLRVERSDRVGHTPLDRHRQGPAVGGQPVADEFGRLVRPTQGAGDHGPAGGAAGGDVLRGHHHRRRAHEHRLPQVLSQTDLRSVGVGAGDERRVRGRDPVDEVDEAGVAIGGALVEGVLAHHVGGGQQEQIRLRLAAGGDAALVGHDAWTPGANRRGDVGS